MKPLEKIIIGTAVIIGFGFLAQQCSRSLIELNHTLPPKSYSVNDDYSPEKIENHQSEYKFYK